MTDDRRVIVCSMKPRRWLRFSLRTLFVLVTVVCVWLGYQLNWIRERRKYLEEHPGVVREPSPQDNVATAPNLLWLLPESGVTRLHVQSPGFFDEADYHHDNPSLEATRARELFPEAIIEVCDDWKFYYAWNPSENWKW